MNKKIKALAAERLRKGKGKPKEGAKEDEKKQPFWMKFKK
jgi:hypothetical protein